MTKIFIMIYLHIWISNKKARCKHPYSGPGTLRRFTPPGWAIVIMVCYYAGVLSTRMADPRQRPQV